MSNSYFKLILFLFSVLLLTGCLQKRYSTMTATKSVYSDLHSECRELRSMGSVRQVSKQFIATANDILSSLDGQLTSAKLDKIEKQLIELEELNLKLRQMLGPRYTNSLYPVIFKWNIERADFSDEARSNIENFRWQNLTIDAVSLGGVRVPINTADIKVQGTLNNQKVSWARKISALEFCQLMSGTAVVANIYYEIDGMNRSRKMILTGERR